MSTTNYLEAVNKLLVELNEVQLTSSTFAGATNIQAFCKDIINRSYHDINSAHYKWPWLATNTSQTEYMGNTYIETVAGQRWYLLNAASTGIDTDYGYVDWDKFKITTNGVAGETTPYVQDHLTFTSVDDWYDFLKKYEDTGKDDSTVDDYAQPERVVRNPDGRYLGLSPIPDKVYRIYFWAWDQLTPVSAFDDVFLFPEQYIPVLMARARYYAWQFKEQSEQAILALQDWKNGIKQMRNQVIEASPDAIEDDRIRIY